jgi:guanosine-3',5'-bis(diphosphate) 3'-pyrophosphohydrolase
MDCALLLRALQFASVKHRNQRRKDANESPYINHLIEVAAVLAAEGRVTEDALLAAAALHDTVEDTETTFAELEEHFGGTIAELVRELTDDKSLRKEQRKQLQIEHARTASAGAKQLKIADKICNLRDIALSPPANWPLERRREYLTWATQVVEGCRGVNQYLDAAFDATLASARQSVDGLTGG